RIALATKYEVTLLADAPGLASDYLEHQPGRYDSLFLPRVTYHTAELNVHDVAFGEDDLWLVATRFGCLATPSADFNLEPRWRPAFLTEIAPEDRCHLNGLALEDGRPKYVTAFGESDVSGGWRERKVGGGIVIDVASGEIVMRGLSMPHSPRTHQGKLWVLNSAKGELLRVDPASGAGEVVCSLPGYLRGLCFCGRTALVGMSKFRERRQFGELPIHERFQALLCGVAAVDLDSGQVVGRFEFTEGCTEIYDVQFLPEMRRPMILNLSHQAVREAISARRFSYWLRPSNLKD
ncbi:MAG TPA: TIGR03032 family protein, partial [Isosphaeraceae bacterium]|nr:TIGR03032 family protein [Isosphaeraceae bacterium]